MAVDKVRVRVLVSFNGLIAGESAWVEDDEAIRCWERAGWVEVSGGGTGEDRSSGPAPGDPGRVDVRAPQGGADGAEPVEDPVSGGHGTSTSVAAREPEPDVDIETAIHDLD